MSRVQFNSGWLNSRWLNRKVALGALLLHASVIPISYSQEAKPDQPPSPAIAESKPETPPVAVEPPQPDEAKPADTKPSEVKPSETKPADAKPADKKSKQNYKDEKRILLHELNKNQQHLSINQLAENCNTILAALQPVWIMNPLSVAQHLPCEREIFDVIIFDEASQIPLEDALPGIYRSAQLIVVGDSQQMPPGQFFSTNSDVKTLLDQASFAFQNVMLKGHYRSEHPSLIEFSNRTFYENELVTIPPLTNDPAIELKKVDGIFTENKNLIEAKAIADHYKHLLKKGVEDIGIIAFSREQQNEIERQIQLLKITPNEKLVLRNLENVQGIEKEIILILFVLVVTAKVHTRWFIKIMICTIGFLNFFKAMLTHVIY